jgi:hypothetical protein
MIEMNLSSPTPFASAVSALSVLGVIVLGVVIFSYLRSRSATKSDRNNSTLYKITARIGAIDKAVMQNRRWKDFPDIRPSDLLAVAGGFR